MRQWGRDLLSVLASILIAGASACERRAVDVATQPVSDRKRGRDMAAPDAPTVAAASTRVILLGSGTPVPDPRRSGPALAVVVAGRAYLVDAGAGVVRRAAAAAEAGAVGLAAEEITHVFITHLHSDHTLGLSDLMLTPAVVGRRDPLQVFGPPGLTAMVKHLQDAYAVDRVVRLHAEGQSDGYAVATHEVTAGEIYRDNHVRAFAFSVPHGDFDDALGYRFDTNDRSVVVSGDTAASDAVVTACLDVHARESAQGRGCDVLVHEVYCAAGLAQLPASVQAYHRRFHTSGPELAALALRARPRLLVLTHLLPFGCSEAQLLAEVTGGYDGEVVLGEDLGVY